MARTLSSGVLKKRKIVVVAGDGSNVGTSAVSTAASAASAAPKPPVTSSAGFAVKEWAKPIIKSIRPSAVRETVHIDLSKDDDDDDENDTLQLPCYLKSDDRTSNEGDDASKHDNDDDDEDTATETNEIFLDVSDGDRSGDEGKADDNDDDVNNKSSDQQLLDPSFVASSSHSHRKQKQRHQKSSKSNSTESSVASSYSSSYPTTKSKKHSKRKHRSHLKTKKKHSKSTRTVSFKKQNSLSSNGSVATPASSTNSDEMPAGDDEEEDDETDDGKLRKFTGKAGQRRCLAIGRGGELCAHVATKGCIYCVEHEGISNPVLRLANRKKQSTVGTHTPSMSTTDRDDDDGYDDGDDEDDVSSSLDFESSGLSKKNQLTPAPPTTLTTKPIPSTKPSRYKQRAGQTQCMAITKKGTQCTFYVSDGCFCHLHENIGESQLVAFEMAAFANLPNNTNPAIATTSELLDDYISTDSEQQQNDEVVVEQERPYTHREFLSMWKKCEDYCGEGTEEIESTRRVRGANTKIAPEDSNGQLKAQYGRLLPRAMKRLMQKIMCLNRDDIFLDIGHGIGNTCLQAAMTMGCESRGIEVVFGRQSVAEVFRDNLISQHEDSVSDGEKRFVGSVHLRHGRLEDRSHRDFLTAGVTKAYVNNFNGVFAERSAKGNDKYFLDDFVGGLFALMKPGTILVSLHPINLGPTRSEANRTRKKHGLNESPDASFYEVDRILLGKACDTVKWNQFSGNQRDIYIYKYTRLKQSEDLEGTVFMCCNPACPLAKTDVRIPATDETNEGRLVISHCECKITRKNLRRQTRKTYTGY